MDNKLLKIKISERIIKLGISFETLKNEYFSDRDDFDWAKGRMDQIEDELEFLERFQESIA